jgi:hypothetical protein
MVYSIDEVVGGFVAENLRELIRCVPKAGSSAAAPLRNDISLYYLRGFVEMKKGG